MSFHLELVLSEKMEDYDQPQIKSVRIQRSITGGGSTKRILDPIFGVFLHINRDFRNEYVLPKVPFLLPSQHVDHQPQDRSLWTVTQTQSHKASQCLSCHRHSTHTDPFYRVGSYDSLDVTIMNQMSTLIREPFRKTSRFYHLYRESTEDHTATIQSDIVR